MKLKKWVKVAIGVLAGTGIISICGYVGVNMYVDSMLNNLNKTDDIKEEEVSIADSVKEQVINTNVVNIALFGTDHDGGEGDDSFERSDATKIISLDMDHKTIMITNLQRDNIIYIPDPINDFDKLNHAQWYGGPQLAVKTINANFDLDITKYVGFSFDSLERIVDLVGGVDIYLTRAEISQQIKPLGVYGDAGVYHLNGHQALTYCRIREIDSDYTRMERQNNVIMAIIDKVKDKNILELVDLANQIMPYIETNLSNEDIKSYLMSLLTFDLSNIKQYQVPEGGFDDINVRSYKGYHPLYLLRSYSDMVKQLHKNIYNDDNYQPSEQLLEIEKSIYEYFGEWKVEDSGA